MGFLNLSDSQLHRWEEAIKATDDLEVACRVVGIQRNEWIAAEIKRLDSASDDELDLPEWAEWFEDDDAVEYPEAPETDILRSALNSAIRYEFVRIVGFKQMKPTFEREQVIIIGGWQLGIEDVPEELSENEEEELFWLTLKRRARGKRVYATQDKEELPKENGKALEFSVGIAELIDSIGIDSFCQKFKVPLTTARDWRSGRRRPPEYVTMMIYKLI